MKTLYELLCELNILVSDIKNLQTVLQIVDYSNDAGEEEVRATLNMAIVHLSTLASATERKAERLDSYILEHRQKNQYLN